MKKAFYTLLITLTLVFGFSINQAFAQCTDFAAGPFTDLNTAFGGAPCDDGTGCPFNEFTNFEVFASEAYVMDNLVAGSEYAFSICNGPGAGTWVPDFAIIAPSGAVDAFGAGDGDGCTISWTASEDGTYLIGINEAEQCGGGPNVATDNGFPAITCVNGPSCAPTVTTCNVGTLTTTGEVSICEVDGTFDFTVMNDTLPTGGNYALIATNNLGGTGGDADGTIAAIIASGNETFNSDLNGFNSYFGDPPLSGTWVFRAALADANNQLCSISADSLIVNFGTESPTVTSIDFDGVDALTANATGGVAPYDYLWDDASAQTTQTAVGLVDGVYTVIISDANGCITSEEATINLSSANSISSLQDLSIVPNPNTGLFNVALTLDQSELVAVEVLDITGRLIESQQRTASTDRFEFNLIDAAAGMYFVRIIVGDESLTQKIIVNK